MSTPDPTITYDLAAEEAPPCPVCSRAGWCVAKEDSVARYYCEHCGTWYLIQRTTNERS